MQQDLAARSERKVRWAIWVGCYLAVNRYATGYSNKIDVFSGI